MALKATQGAQPISAELPGQVAEAEGFEPSMGLKSQTALAVCWDSSEGDGPRMPETLRRRSQHLCRLAWLVLVGTRTCHLVPAPCHQDHPSGLPLTCDHAPAGGRSGSFAPGRRMYQRMNSRITRPRGLRPSGYMARVAASNGSHSSSGARKRRGVSYSVSASGVMPARVRLCSHRRQGQPREFVATNSSVEPLAL